MPATKKTLTPTPNKKRWLLWGVVGTIYAIMGLTLLIVLGVGFTGGHFHLANSVLITLIVTSNINILILFWALGFMLKRDIL